MYDILQDPVMTCDLRRLDDLCHVAGGVECNRVSECDMGKSKVNASGWTVRIRLLLGALPNLILRKIFLATLPQLPLPSRRRSHPVIVKSVSVLL